MENRDIKQVLQDLHQQYLRRLAFRYFIPGLLWGAGVALVWTLIASVLGVASIWNSAALKLIIVLAGGFIGTIPLALSLPSVYGLAKRLDDDLGLKDQLSTAYALQGEAEGQPMVSILLEDVSGLFDDPRFNEALPKPHFGSLAAAALLFAISAALSAGSVKSVEKPKLGEQTRFELKRQAKKLDDLMRLELGELTEEEKHQFEQIRQMIEKLQLEDKNISRKEMLARFSREIEGLEEMEEGSAALKKMLDQLKEMKDAVASRVLIDRQIEEIEKQHTELAVVDAKTGETLKAEEIAVMEVQEERHRQQQAMAKEIEKVAEEEKQKEDVSQWVVAEGQEDGTGAGEEGQGPTKKTRVVVSYEDLVKAAEKKDIRQMIFAAAEDDERTTTQYREVYTNYERAFKNLLFQGTLSLGTRQYLQRYFRSIRPKLPKAKKEKAPVTE